MLVVTANRIPFAQVKSCVAQQLVGMVQSIEGELVRDPLGIVVCMVDLLRFLAGVHANQKAISWGQDVGKLFDKSGSLFACEIANAGAQGQNNFRPACVLCLL